MQQMDSIFVAGMPRAGSMWTYNVARKLIVLAGKTPWPERMPPDERGVVEEAFCHSAGAGRVHCIKTHYAIPVDRPNVRILCNFRDIRDATLSFMRFMKCSFPAALESARASMEITDHFLQSGSLSVMPVDYEDVVGEPHSAAIRIADFIGVDATPAEIDGIVQELSRKRIADRLRKMSGVKVNEGGGIDSAADAESGQYTTVRNADGSYRVYDYETGFQSNHITSSREGEWREAFTPEQQQVLNALLGDWLRRYGFEV